MEKKFPFFKTLTLLVWLVLGMDTAFADDTKTDENCPAGTKWGGFTTVIPDTTSDGVYKISSPDELAWFSCKVTKIGSASIKKNAILTQSIDLQSKLFIPIAAGKGTPSYGGIFDGQGYTIKNLFIDASEIVKSENGGNNTFAQNVALFAVLKGGTVRNLSLENVSIYAASSAGDAGTSGKENPISVGAIAGFVESGTINGCAASGKIETSGNVNRVGGIAGNVWVATISNCISEVNVFAAGDETHVGGIVGVIRDKTGTVTLESCVYAGETLFSNNGSVGAIAGQYEKKGNITSNDLYYTSDYPAVGTGLEDRPFDSKPVENLNTEDVICELNGGTWKTDNQTCSGASDDGVWSEGQNNLSINGSDGFRVTFDAYGGAFAEGTKVSKFFAKNATITANEIENPTFAGNKFAGWSLTQGGDVQNLGKADKAKTVYAVWKPIRTITFNAGPGAFDGGSSEASKLVAEGDVVTVEGLPALPVSFCSSVSDCAYFYGWSTQSHDLYDDYDDIPEGTIVDLPSFTFSKDETLYAVWVKSETYTVTFNANGHGQTTVEFVKVADGKQVQQPSDPIADNGYKFSGRWCETSSPCTEETKFNFDEREITQSIVLYADWNVSEYNIIYNIDGEPNTETGNPTTYKVDSDLITLVKPEKAGHVFNGWYDENGNEATTILKGSFGNRTFHGSWIPVTYTITYLADNTLSATTTSDEKIHGVAKTLKGATFVHGGCTQDGWSKVSYGKNGYNLDYVVGGSYEEDKDVILFPHWNCNTFSITYNLLDGEGIAANHKDNPSVYTGPAKLTLKNAYDSQDRIFMDDWYKERGFKNTIRDIQNIDANLTVYARWYNKITYNPGSRLKAANSQLGSTTDKKYWNKDYTIKSSVKDFVLEKYTLDGWSTTDGGEKAYNLNVKYTANENLTLYPHWVEKCDSVQYGAVKIYTYATDGRKEAVINGEYNGSDAVNIPDLIEVDNIVINRTFTANTPSTIMLPFELPEGTNLNGAKFYYLKSVAQEEGKNTWKATMKWIGSNKLPEANKPYGVICPSSTLELSLNGNKATFKTTQQEGKDTVYYEVSGGDWRFVGVYAKKQWQTGDEELEGGLAYALAGTAGKGLRAGDFGKVTSENWTYPLRSYMRKKDNTVQLQSLPQAVRARGASYGLNSIGSEIIEVEFVDDEKTTAIGRMNTVTGEIKIDRWFDLKGRSVKNVNRAAKGAYYGKKVFHE